MRKVREADLDAEDNKGLKQPVYDEGHRLGEGWPGEGRAGSSQTAGGCRSDPGEHGGGVRAGGKRSIQEMVSRRGTGPED